MALTRSSTPSNLMTDPIHLLDEVLVFTPTDWLLFYVSYFSLKGYVNVFSLLKFIMIGTVFFFFPCNIFFSAFCLACFCIGLPGAVAVSVLIS